MKNLNDSILTISTKHLYQCIKTFGIAGLDFNWRFFSYKIWGIKNIPKKTKKLKLKQYKNYVVNYRTNSSDVPLVHSILVWKGEYDVAVDESKFDAVLDLGANIGLFSLYYSLKYPEKKLIAVEPEKNNAAIASLNISGCSNAKLIQSGIWWRPSKLKIENHGLDWSFTVNEVEDNEQYDAVGIDIDSICKEYGIDNCNLLVKMDIEGTERVIFEHINEVAWINHTQYLIIEIHGDEESELYKNICEAMKDKGFSWKSRGENTFFYRI